MAETNLPPDVAEAMKSLGTRFISTSDGAREVAIIRDYLLQVTAENALLHESALGGYEDGWHALRNERDALRAMIDGAPLVRVRGKVGEVCMLPVSHDFCGKRVRLVVEDGHD